MTRRTAILALAGPLAGADLSPQLRRAEPNADYLALDVRTGATLAQHWDDGDTPIPVGSLVKPFLAMAWVGSYPEVECKGAAGGCWRVQPHGRLNFPSALAQSCNAYFLQFAAKVDEAELQNAARSLAITSPAKTTPQARIGLGDDWRIAPSALLGAYRQLVSRRGDPRVDAILAGLELAARSGTAREFGPGVLAKTGTAPCISPRRHAGDGLAVGMFPAESPSAAILVRVHNVPGAEAARTGARLLQMLRG